MQVTFILSSFPKLSETFVLSQITGLIDRGVDVRVVAGFPTGETCVHGDFVQYELADRVTYVFPDKDDRRTSWLAELRRNPVLAIKSMRPLKYGRKASNGNLQAWARTVQAFEKVNSSDVFLAHFGAMGDLTACIRETGACDAPIAVVLHGWDVAVPLHQGKRLYPRLRKWADKLLPISDRWKNALLDDGYHQDRIQVHRVGVDVPEKLPVRKITPPAKLLSVCRFVEKKGLEYAVQAVAKLVADGHDVSYTIVGNGPLENELHRLVESLNITNNVNFTGPLPKAEVRKAMLEHDVFLAPSVTASNGDQEGIPTAIMEAMSVGMLVASTEHSGIPELVRHENNGLLSKEKDVEGLAQNILQLIAESESTGSFRTEGFKHVHACFNIESLNDRLKVLLSSLVRQP